MRFLSMIRVFVLTGQQPTEKLMNDMGKLMDEMIRDGTLISTQGLLPTAQGMRVRLRRGQVSMTEGPFTETKEVIGGYAIFEAKDLADAVKQTRRFLDVHGEEWDIECEVRPLAGPEMGCGRSL